MSALPYCESWLCDEYGKINNVYMSIIKSLLWVRKSTCNDTCLLEANFPSLKSYVTQRKKSFFQKKWPLIEEGDPLYRAMELVKQKNTKSYRMIEKLLNVTSNIITGERENLKEKILNSNTTKRISYCKLNPLLKCPNIYNSVTIKEYQRITFSRFRLSSHNLKIETDRWNRIPREQRVCPCHSDKIQSEKHATIEWPFVII